MLENLWVCIISFLGFWFVWVWQFSLKPHPRFPPTPKTSQLTSMTHSRGHSLWSFMPTLTLPTRRRPFDWMFRPANSKKGPKLRRNQNLVHSSVCFLHLCWQPTPPKSPAQQSRPNHRMSQLKHHHLPRTRFVGKLLLFWGVSTKS